MPKDIRRVVSGFDAGDKSIWTSDEIVRTYLVENKAVGFRVTDLWRIPKLPTNVRAAHGVPEKPPTWPDMEGLVFRIAEAPPKSAYRAHPEAIPKGPDGKPVDIDDQNFGMHASDTIDIAVVISGEIWTYQDGAKEGVLLKQGDILIQRGTMHSWHNKGDKPCIYAVCLVGATGRPKTAGGH